MTMDTEHDLSRHIAGLEEALKRAKAKQADEKAIKQREADADVRTAKAEYVRVRAALKVAKAHASRLKKGVAAPVEEPTAYESSVERKRARDHKYYVEVTVPKALKAREAKAAAAAAKAEAGGVKAVQRYAKKLATLARDREKQRERRAERTINAALPAEAASPSTPAVAAVEMPKSPVAAPVSKRFPPARPYGREKTLPRPHWSLDQWLGTA